MSNKVKIVLMAAMVLGIAFMVSVKLYRSDESQKIAAIQTKSSKTLVPDHAIRLGRADAPVTMVEFLDPECESCRAFYPMTKQLLEEFEGKLQLVIRYAPFHGNSVMMVKILEAARKQNRYWETLENLFQHQPEWGSHHHPRPDLVWQFLPEAGVDVEKLKVDMEDTAIAKLIDQDKADGMALNVRMTPAFFVNGKPLESFGYEQLRELIVSELPRD